MSSHPKYLLHLADDALVLGHRNSEWTGHGPILEQDIALSNISLDLIGQARNFYQLAADRIGDGTTEDELAYLRGAGEYLNNLICEQENGHWGKTVLRQYLVSQYKLLLFQHLEKGNDRQMAAIAEKSLKEIQYHLRWSGEWVIRLGQGTEVSHEKMQDALDAIWCFTEELNATASYEFEYVADPGAIAGEWTAKVGEVMQRAGLKAPINTVMQKGGKEGQHTAALETMLQEMQHLQRTYPGLQW